MPMPDPGVRPAMRYHGGKWKLAPWIVRHFPDHRVYVEPFGGGASVLLRKPRSYAEVYNDLSGEIVNVFRVLRDQGCELRQALRLTPFARDEFVLSYEPAECPVEQARRTIFRSFAGFGGGAACGRATGFRSNSNRSGTTPAHDWANYPDRLPAIIERLRGVVIENCDALECMARHDGPQTLHYVDPPYVKSERAETDVYQHEMDDQGHERLAEHLHGLKGMVVLSGYRCELYDALYRDWGRVDTNALADGAPPRVESLWMSPNIPQWGLFHA